MQTQSRLIELNKTGIKNMIFFKEHCFQYAREFRTMLCANASISAESCLNATEEQKQDLLLKIMPQRRPLTQNERHRALGYLLASQTQSQVVSEVNVNQSVNCRLWQLYLDTGDVLRRPGQSRLRVKTDAQDLRLSLMARCRRFDSAVRLGRDFEQTFSYRISAQTVKNLRARRPVVRPPLTPRHRRCRLVFARDNTPFGSLCLRNVLWTDESKFNLDFNDGRRRVRRQRNERFRKWCVVEHDQFGEGSVLIWAGISYDGRTDLYVIRNGALTGVRYRDDNLHHIVCP